MIRDKDLANLLKENIERKNLGYDNLRVVERKGMYESEGCEWCCNIGYALVKDGSSDFILKGHEGELMFREPGIRGFFWDFSKSLLTGLFGGGVVPIRPTDIGEIIAEIHGDSIEFYKGHLRISDVVEETIRQYKNTLPKKVSC